MAEQARFELAHQYSRSTPLAGAPLQPLEYYSELLLDCTLNKYVCQYGYENFYILV